MRRRLWSALTLVLSMLVALTACSGAVAGLTPEEVTALGPAGQQRFSDGTYVAYALPDGAYFSDVYEETDGRLVAVTPEGGGTFELREYALSADGETLTVKLDERRFTLTLEE